METQTPSAADSDLPSNRFPLFEPNSTMPENNEESNKSRLALQNFFEGGYFFEK